MDRLCKPELCTGCGACAAICPGGCISMTRDSEGFSRPVLDANRCISCGLCSSVCPVLGERNLSPEKTVAYGAVNLDMQVRRDSTSGGVFTLLSRWVIRNGGVVFGAAYDEDYSVVHCRVERTEDLWKLRGAKYSQSEMGAVYRETKTLLKEGRYVLFSGTPCQTAGLRSFLNKSDDRLILVDLICHGVPSPKVWKHYIAYRSNCDAAGAEPAAINLRSKETGWPGYSVRFAYPGGRVYSELSARDPYLRGFVKNVYLRHSCYHCKFKGIQRESDFTLGDYWGVWDQCPEMNDGNGTSLVLLHTDKAKRLWEQIAEDMRFSEVDAAAALADNPSALMSPEIPESRLRFFERYEQEDFRLLIDALCPLPASPKKRTVFGKIKRGLRRILNYFLQKGRG